MRIGIITGSLGENIAGLGRYTEKLTINLLRIDNMNDYTLIDFELDREVEKGGMELLEQTSKLSFQPLGDILLSLKVLGKRNVLSRSEVAMFFWLMREYLIDLNIIDGYYGLRNHITLPIKLSTKNLDVLHGPAHFIPLFSLGKYKKVITVHDITPILFPETHPKRAVRLYSHIFPKQLNFADKLIADSQSTKNDLIEHLKVPCKKIVTIPLGVDKQFRPLKDRNSIKEHSFKSNFILFIGTIEPRKNVVTLIRAFYKLKKKGIKHTLVIAGRKDRSYNKALRAIEKLGLEKDVILTGHFPERDLPILYNAADLFVYPSIYEGFGLPPLEAMACGCPVITSNTSSLPEVVGDAGIMINPNNVDALADAMYRVLTNEGLRQDMIKKGLKRAKMFSWEKTAKETLRVYEEVYNE